MFRLFFLESTHERKINVVHMMGCVFSQIENNVGKGNKIFFFHPQSSQDHNFPKKLGESKYSVIW